MRQAAAEKEWEELKGEGDKLSNRVQQLEGEGKALARKSALGDLIFGRRTLKHWKPPSN